MLGRCGLRAICHGAAGQDETGSARAAIACVDEGEDEDEDEDEDECLPIALCSSKFSVP